MSERRSPGTMIVPPPRVGDAIGAALRNAYRGEQCAPSEWDVYVQRLDAADRKMPLPRQR